MYLEKIVREGIAVMEVDRVIGDSRVQVLLATGMTSD